jgi:hypothetical protein
MLEECVQDGINVGDDVQSVHHGQIVDCDDCGRRSETKHRSSQSNPSQLVRSARLEKGST